MKISTFTTRADTIYGVSFLVLAPEYPDLVDFASDDQKDVVADYIKQATAKSELERQQNKEKTGVFTGRFVKHPLTGEQIPVWVADYVLMGYGTGAIMAVPAHDQRDFEFAQKYGLEIKPVIKPFIKEQENETNNDIELPFVGKGVAINSEIINDMPTDQAIETMTLFLETQNKGSRQTNYKFRNWVFSRQRYWGEPFPFEYVIDSKNNQPT